MNAISKSSADFRRALAQFATGIAVVTTRAADQTPAGLTINSFASVSLDPPLVLWSLARTSSSFTAFSTAQRYLIHVLAADQLQLAQRFATRGPNKFDGGGWHDHDGLPLIEGCIAWFECGRRSCHEEGDHVILVGSVERLHVDGGAPLIFHDSRYITDLTETPLPAALRWP